MHWTFNRLVTTGLFLTSPLVLSTSAFANQAADAVAPEHSTGFEQKQLVKAKDYMVTAATHLPPKLVRMFLHKVVMLLMPWLPCN